MGDRRAELLNERRTLVARVDEIDREVARIRIAEVRAEHTCDCVRLNGDIGVYDMVEQERSGRQTLMYAGLVAERLSARKSCPKCHGTGKPKAQP